LDSRSRAAELLPLVPAAAIPFLFLHRRYQAHTSFGAVDVFGSDIAVALTVAAALLAGAWWGFSSLRRARPLWIVAGAMLGLYFVACFWTPFDHTSKHLITAAKIAEYALLAPSLVLLLRRRVDVDRFLVVFVGWSVVASAWGLLQFLGLVNEFEGKRPGQREVSFLGIHDFAAFSAAALAIALAGIALGERRRIVVVAAFAGTVGSILAASVFAFSGIALAAIVACVVGVRGGTLNVRRGLALAAITLVVGGGVLALRGSDVTNFFSFLGESTPRAATTEDIQTGSHRVVLGYIGLRIWQDHPLLGIGFERSTTGYEPYLDDARRKFPDEAPEAFPSPKHAWGVQNFWIQTLADVGIVGLALVFATFAVGLALAWQALGRARLPALVALGWILVAAGTWNANGILAGIPLDALTWFGFGLAATVGGLE
jgi:O-antigen ligase